MKKLLLSVGGFIIIFLLIFIVLIAGIIGKGGGSKGSTYISHGEYMTGQMSPEDYDKLKDMIYGDTLGDRMISLQGKITYQSTDGTNCMRTVSLCLDPSDPRYAVLGGGKVVNCDQAVEIAKQNGFYESYGKYPDLSDLREGDILVYGNDQHHVAVVGPGGTLIQNGASHNTVYESTDINWNGEVVSGVIRNPSK